MVPNPVLMVPNPISLVQGTRRVGVTGDVPFDANL
jgi:hypothetical protein